MQMPFLGEGGLEKFRISFVVVYIAQGPPPPHFQSSSAGPVAIVVETKNDPEAQSNVNNFTWKKGVQVQIQYFTNH